MVAAETLPAETPPSEQPPRSLSALQALLPPPPLPIGSYVAVTRVGNLLYTSGVLPMEDGQVAYIGAVGSWDADVTHGKPGESCAGIVGSRQAHRESDGLC